MRPINLKCNFSRYFDQEKTRSRSLDNLLGEPPLPEPNPLVELGLSQTSKLNERYHSVEQLAPIKPVVMQHQNYMSKQEIDFEYPDIGSVSTSHRDRSTPRYIKSQYAGKLMFSIHFEIWLNTGFCRKKSTSCWKSFEQSLHREIRIGGAKLRYVRY